MGTLFRCRVVVWAFILGSLSLASQAAVLEVGPGKKYAKPSEAANAAGDGDVIEIMAGTYMYDVAIWAQNDLTIRGVGGRAHLQADGAAAGEKAIWVIEGDNVTIENIEFSGARVRDRNGAGIRQEGTNVTIRNCYFHHN
ncbi:MAG: right-handed parallel beta-helix repeat-containing protein, partial [Gammaproteobacteria bacterium]